MIPELVVCGVSCQGMLVDYIIRIMYMKKI